MQSGQVVECRDMPVKVLAEMADALDQAYHSLSRAEAIAQSAQQTFAAQREMIAVQKWNIAMLMGVGMNIA